MKYLMSLFFVLGLMGCTSEPKYTVGTCFEENPFLVHEIVKVTETHYHIASHSFYVIRSQFKHKIFEEKMDKVGGVGVSCKEYVKEKKTN